MPRKSRRGAASQQRGRQQKSQTTGKKEITPLPQAGLTAVAQTQQAQSEEAVDTTTPSTPEASTQPRKVIRPQASGGPSVYEYVAPELRRIVGMMTLVAILLVVLTIVLR